MTKQDKIKLERSKGKMKKISMAFLGLVAIILITGCGNKETERKLICTNTQSEDGINVEQTISMTFKNDKINHMKMDVNSKITDEQIKANWTEFTQAMDSQNEETEKDGVSLKVSKDDENYEYKVTLDVDLEKATKDDLETYELTDLLDDNSTLEDNKKSAESDGFTCKVQ